MVNKKARKKFPVSPAALPTDPYEPTCYRCEISGDGDYDGFQCVFLSAPTVLLWLCLPCCEELVAESVPPKKSTSQWYKLPACSRCEAQVPGMARLPGDGDFQFWWLCHQCCVTLWRHVSMPQQG